MGYKLKRILIYPDGVTEKQVYPALPIPSSGLLGYRPLHENANDMSGNGYNGTLYGSPTFGTYQGKQSVRLDTNGINNGSTNYIITSLNYSTPYEIAYNDSTSLCTQPTGTTAGNVTLNVKLNLSTGLIEYKLTGPETYTVSATLTSAQLENVLTYKNIGVIGQSLQQSQTCRIYTVELKVV